jgi:hypothetical protein
MSAHFLLPAQEALSQVGFCVSTVLSVNYQIIWSSIMNASQFEQRYLDVNKKSW